MYFSSLDIVVKYEYGSIKDEFCFLEECIINIVVKILHKYELQIRRETKNDCTKICFGS